MENQAKSLTPRQSNFPAVHVFSAFCFFFSLLSVPCFALPAGALPYPCPSLGDGGLIQERFVIWVKFQGKNSPGCLAQIFSPSKQLTLCPSGLRGWTQVPLVQTVGSNPTGVIWPHSSSPTPTTKQSVAAAGMLSPTEALSPGRAVRGLSLTVQAFEPLRAEPIGFRVQLLSRADTVSSAS